MNSAGIAKYVLTDSGFWIGLYNKQDQFHERSLQVLEIIQRFHLLFPWPVLYEVLNTKFVKNKNIIRQFRSDLQKLTIDYIDDSPYREEAKEEAMASALDEKRRISLVDMVVRHVLADINFRVDYLVTYNERDFSDVCKKRRVEIVNR